MFAKEAIDFQSGWWLKSDKWTGAQFWNHFSRDGWGGKWGTRGLSPHLIGALTPSLVSFAMTLWTHLWDRRLYASHLPGSGAHAFLQASPKAHSQGAGDGLGLWTAQPSCFCCCLTSFYGQVQSLALCLGVTFPGLRLLIYSPLCPVAVACGSQHWWTQLRAVWPLRMCSCTSLGRVMGAAREEAQETLSPGAWCWRTFAPCVP